MQTKDSRASASKSDVQASPRLGAVTNEALVAQMKSSFELSAKAASAIQEELVGFVQQRIKSNVAMRDAFLKCKTLEDALKAQSEWARGAADDYMQESTRLFDLVRQMMDASFSPLLRGNGRPKV